MSPPTTENYTQPAECKYASENLPTIPGSKFSTLVPLYQEDHHGSDMSKILESCCSTSIWFYEDPQPCTAVCTASSDAKAQDVQYCLNAREVNYGGDGIANAVNYAAHMIIMQAGHPVPGTFPTVAYIGLEDPRYLYVVIGAIKAGYKALWLSREQNANALGNPGLDSKSIGGYEALYQQDFLSEDFTPFTTPLPWSDLALPRVYVQIAGLDILRDDGLVYAEALEESGVEVKLDVYPGMPHGHFNIWPHLKQSIKSQEDTIWHIGWLLRQELPRERVNELVARMI
ncbi:unnamed protein product [Penicillium pancosmium]